MRRWPRPLVWRIRDACVGDPPHNAWPFPERGVAAVEFMGVISYLLFAALAAWQLLLAGAVVTAAENAARTGSRKATLGEDGASAAVEALPSWLRPGADARASGTKVTISVPVPVILPGLELGGLRATREAELPPDASGGSGRVAVPGASGAPAGVWDDLAQCESSGDWSINTGNGYYGGLQFSAESWRLVGGTGLPHQASKEEQIMRAERLQALQGWRAWPVCSERLGLSGARDGT